MENVATTHFFALFARFLHFHENNDLKVPERSKNGPKKVPILSQRPKFCLCSDFSRQVPNPKSYIGAPASVVMTNAGPNQLFIAVLSPTVPLLLRGLDCSRQPPFPPRHSEKYKSMLIVDSNHMQPNALLRSCVINKNTC